MNLLGQPAPDFELPDADMTPVRLSDYRGRKNVVLYFYPKDDTPGCTIEAQEFSDLLDEFERLDTVVLGVSPDNCMSHGEFRDKYGLTVRLLADPEAKVCEAYGVMKEVERNGETRRKLERSTFIIDRDGIVQMALHDVGPRGHAGDVLEIVREL